MMGMLLPGRGVFFLTSLCEGWFQRQDRTAVCSSCPRRLLPAGADMFEGIPTGRAGLLRAMNGVPSMLMIGIILLAVLKRSEIAILKARGLRKVHLTRERPFSST